MDTTTSSLITLQDEWKYLYQTTLPTAARAKSPSQPIWPIHNDHCFARIILDTIIGNSVPWTTKLKSPAYKNMTGEQLEGCIQLGKQILDGEVDLVVLNERSLEMRGKNKGKNEQKKLGKAESKDNNKEVISKYFTQSTLGKRKEDTKDGEEHVHEDKSTSKPTLPSLPSPKKQKLSSTSTSSSTPQQPHIPKELAPYISKIHLSNKTPFQKSVLLLICQIPRGKTTTYGAISAHLSSSARAVGNALRNNPFAPQVPCHRILATGGGIGGFHGSWGRKGEKGLNDDSKLGLLRGEGVMFDRKGKLVGEIWTGFK